MSSQELASAESFLLESLRSAGKPLSVRDVLDELRNQENASVSSLAIRGAVWQLVDRGLVELTPDNHITLAAEPREALPR